MDAVRKSIIICQLFGFRPWVPRQEKARTAAGMRGREGMLFVLWHCWGGKGPVSGLHPAPFFGAWGQEGLISSECQFNLGGR